MEILEILEPCGEPNEAEICEQFGGIRYSDAKACFEQSERDRYYTKAEAELADGPQDPVKPAVCFPVAEMDHRPGRWNQS